MVLNSENQLMMAGFTTKLSLIKAKGAPTNSFQIIMDGDTLTMPSKPCKVPLLVFPRNKCIKLLSPLDERKHQ